MVKKILRHRFHFVRELFFFKTTIFTLFILNPAVSQPHAQLIITSPLNNQVQQRNNLGVASISITAYSYFPYSKVEAQLLPEEGNKHPKVEWVFDQQQIQQGFLNTTIQAKTGWYKLKLRGYAANGITDTAIVSRVGVGEVFLVAGNSNAMGIPGLGSKNASGNVVAFNATNKMLNQEIITVAPDEPMQLPKFTPVISDNLIFPSGEASWYWGELGDLLFKKMNTPVLFLNAAWAAANSENYRDAASGKDAYNLYVGKNWPNRQPYTNLINTIRYFNSWLGARAVLWSHGENDGQLGFTEDNYFNNIKTLIENSRRDSGYDLPWFIARNSVSYTSDRPYQPVINAQNQLSILKNLNTFPGPNLDTIQVPRPGHGHFENIKGGTQGLSLAAAAWNRTLTDSVFQKVIPFEPKTVIYTGIVPSALKPGASFLLPFRVSGSNDSPAEIHAELLNEEGKFVETVGIGNESPLSVTLPENIKNGIYKLRVVGRRPILAGSRSTEFYVDKSLSENDFIHHISARLMGQQIVISWLMAANPELTQMVLQKTTDGETYSDLQTVAAINNQNDSRLYYFSDLNADESTIFYRIRLEHQNGKISHSPVVTVFQKGAPPRFIVFPNPVVKEFYLRSDEAEPILKCNLFDVLGREHPVLTNQREVIGVTTARPVYELPAGNYFLRIVSQTGVSTQTVLFR
ncbi:T9SS type A sorting domain-containing protein [Dyadobacter psychrotolerans]|uniref:T9SS type A sorting domain-containing protein n=1 Tax=Dyadobacter psychrotolerans TaxID=2541721 RepID=A0A4R5DJA1_9BACT|nr:sialate O-acetylesterase [Dyadobacter psychrotolerans]TDE12060.1 T9SS type A sorting domain-containing protein [Dyadobacter psychrotolerans]